MGHTLNQFPKVSKRAKFDIKELYSRKCKELRATNYELEQTKRAKSRTSFFSPERESFGIKIRNLQEKLAIIKEELEILKLLYTHDCEPTDELKSGLTKWKTKQIKPAK